MLFDLARLPLLNGIFSLIGTANTLFDTVSVSVLPTVVAGEDLRKTNGRFHAGQIVANTVAGPPLGDLLFASAATLPFLRDADTLAAAVTLIFTPKL